MDNEEFEYLDEVIEELIDKFLIYRKNQYNRTNDEIIEKSLKLFEIERYDFEDEELEYVMNYLKERDIYVVGTSPALYTVFDNYRCVNKMWAPRKSIELTLDEQFDLIKKYKNTSDIKYRDKLVESYLEMVNFFAKKYSALTGLDQDELASYGYEGLLVAIDKIDLSKNTFGSYFYNYVKGFILGGIPKEQGFNSGEFYSQYISARKEILQKYEYEDVSEYQLLDEIIELTLKNRPSLKKNQEDFKDRFFLNYATSLDGQELIDENSLYQEVVEKEYQSKLKATIDDALEELTERQKQVIIKRFGLDGNAYLSLEEVSSILGKTRQSNHQAMKIGIRQIKNNNFDILQDLYTLSNHEYDYDKYAIIPSDIVQKKKV